MSPRYELTASHPWITTISYDIGVRNLGVNMRSASLVFALLGLATIAACSTTNEPRLKTPDASPSFGKTSVDTTRRGRYVWADSVNVGTDASPQWVAAGFTGDGRDRYGAPATGATRNEFQGSFCGVRAYIFNGTSGNAANFNYYPSVDWTSSMAPSCGGTNRYYRVYLSGPSGAPSIANTAHEVIDTIYTLAVGQSHIQPMWMGTETDLGIGLHYDDAAPPSNDVIITRLPDVIDEFGRTVRQWRMSSRGTHLAMGFVSGKHGLVQTQTYYLPFSMTITEVPYPYPTYP